MSSSGRTVGPEWGECLMTRAPPVPSFVATTGARKSPAQQQEEQMHKYVIERTVPGAGAMDEAALAAITTQSNAVLRELGPDIQWLHSYVSDDNITCVYLAANEELIREHARCGGFP